MSSERHSDEAAKAAPTVSVVGEAAVRTQPDEAFLSITLSAMYESPGPALADVAKRSESLATMLDELGISRDDRSTTGVNVTEEFDHTEQGRRSLGHRATASLSVRVADPELIGRVMMRSSGELDAAHCRAELARVAETPRLAGGREPSSRKCQDQGGGLCGGR